MYVVPGGELYGFCPAKATWDLNLAKTFQLLIIAAESGAMIEKGGLRDQPDWWIEALGWFLPRYDQQKFQSRMKSVLGDGKVQKVIASSGLGRGSSGGNKRKPAR